MLSLSDNNQADVVEAFTPPQDILFRRNGKSDIPH